LWFVEFQRGHLHALSDNNKDLRRKQYIGIWKADWDQSVEKHHQKVWNDFNLQLYSHNLNSQTHKHTITQSHSHTLNGSCYQTQSSHIL
jgi:hypothetical protein